MEYATYLALLRYFKIFENASTFTKIIVVNVTRSVIIIAYKLEECYVMKWHMQT